MKNVDSSNFKQEVLENSKPVVVDFWASWCQPCIRFTPVFEEVSKEYPNTVFVKLNVDDNPEIASQRGVMSIPRVKVFSNGREIGEIIGNHDKESFKTKLDKIINK
jgi:thioredoxin 1